MALSAWVNDGKRGDRSFKPGVHRQPDDRRLPAVRLDHLLLSVHQVLQHRVIGVGPVELRHVSVSRRLAGVLALRVYGEPVAEPFDRRAACVLGCARVDRGLRIGADDRTPPTHRCRKAQGAATSIENACETCCALPTSTSVGGYRTQTEEAPRGSVDFSTGSAGAHEH
jgi:predicted ATPase